MAENKFIGAPPSPPYGPHGTLKIVPGGPEYTARGTLKMPLSSPDHGPTGTLKIKPDATEAERVSSETEEMAAEVVRAAEQEIANAKAEAQEAELAIERAESAGAAPEEVAELRAEERQAQAEVEIAQSELEQQESGEAVSEEFSKFDSMEVGELETEYRKADAEYGQAMADIREAAAAGATKAKLNWLRSKAKRIGTRLAYIAHKLDWEHSQESYAPKEPKPEELSEAGDQLVYEMNDVFERFGPRLQAGEDMGDVLSEVELTRLRHQREVMTAMERNPDMALEMAGKIKIDELAENTAYRAMQELELDQQGEGRKKYIEFLKSRGLASDAVAEKLESFDNGLEYALERRNQNKFYACIDGGDFIEAARIYVKYPNFDYAPKQGKRFTELLVLKMKEVLEGSLDQGIDFYRQLPDGLPVSRDLEWALYAKAQEMTSNVINFDLQKQRMMELLARAPEALVDISSGPHTYMSWRPEERFKILSSIDAIGGKKSAIARFGPNGFPESRTGEANGILFKAYLQVDPKKIIENIWNFRDQYLALPADEQGKIKKKYMSDDGYYTPYLTQRLQHVPLTGEEFKRFLDASGHTAQTLVAALEQSNPAALFAKCNTEHFGLDKGKRMEFFKRWVDRKPYKAVDEAENMDLDQDQVDYLKKKLVETTFERLGRSNDNLLKVLEATTQRSGNDLIGLRDSINSAFVLARALGNESFARVLDKGGHEAGVAMQAFSILRNSDMPNGLAEKLAQSVVDHQDPMSEAQRLVKNAAEITAQDPGALEVAHVKALGMVKKLLDGSPEERAAFVARALLAKERAGNMLDKIPNTAYERFFTYDDARALAYLGVYRRINESPSQEIQKLAEQLADQISASDDPEATYEKIEGIFLRNNLPTVGKVFKVFETLHPQSKLEAKLQQWNLSPTLRAERHRGRMMTIYKDLLHAHIESDNASLRQYLGVLREGEGIMAVADAVGVEALDDGQRKTLRSFLDKLKLLQENSMYGRMGGGQHVAQEGGDVTQEYAEWRQGLGVAPGQSVTQRLSEMFLRPLGYESVEQVLERMDSAKREAEERNAEFAVSGQLELKEGDLLKGVDDRYLGSIMQNGSVAKEYLGASSDSDTTPLDADVGRVTAQDVTNGFFRAFAATPAGKYGEVAFLVRNRGQFQETSPESDIEELRKKSRERKPALELFRTGAVDQERHYGVRTGFPMTQVDAMVVGENIAGDSKALDSLCMQVVQNGFYIPIADRSGKVLFSPEAYRAFREKYNVGLERLGGRPFELQSPDFETVPAHAQALDRIKGSQRQEKDKIVEITKKINDQVFKALSELGIETYGGDESVVVRPELIDTGSSGRGTNVPGDFDFDLVLKLNPKDMHQVVQIQNRIMQVFDGTDNGSHQEQLRLKEGKVPGINQGLEIDIAFVSKSELAVYESHDAVKERLDNMSPEVREEVQANVILAKKILKEAGAYKKTEGGLGGIGLENFILQNGGNVAVAFKRFQDAAFKNGNLVPFDEFKRSFKVIDPGLNAKFNKHDNFIEQNMTATGYEKMAKAVSGYLGKISQVSTVEVA